MKILYWTNSFWPCLGGLETQVMTLVQAAQARGHQCTIITGQFSAASPKYEEYQAIPIYRYPFEKVIDQHDLKGITSILSDIKKFVAEFKPDVMHFNYSIGTHLFVFHMLRKITSIPTLVTIHGFSIHNELNLEGVLKRLFKTCEWISCVSNAVLTKLRKNDPQLSKKSSLLYNALPMPLIKLKSPSFEPPKILCLGRLTEEKGIDIAIGAFHILSKKVPNIELIIAGDGVERNYLKKLTSGLQLGESVKFVGKVKNEEVSALLNTVSIVVVPSRYEAFGLIALEAMQMARPVIASRVGGLAEIISHQNTGLLIPRNNIDELAAAIEYLLTHPEVAIQMGQCARDDVKARFNINKMTDEYEKAYLKVIKINKKSGALV